MLLPLPMTTHGRRSRAARRRTAASASGVRTSTRNRAGPPTPSVQWSARDAPSSRRTSPSASRGLARARRGSSRRAAGSPSSTGAPRRSRANAAATWADDARSAARSEAIRAKGVGRVARARARRLARPSSGGTPPRLPSARVPGPRRIADGDETARRETGSIARLHEGGPAASLDADAIASRGRVCARPAAERRVFCQQRRLTSRDSIES